MLGYEGQSVSIIPSRDLVIVRLGLTRHPEHFNLERLLFSILEAMKR